MNDIILQLLRNLYHSALMPIFLKVLIKKINSKYRAIRYKISPRYYFPWSIDGKINLIGEPLFQDSEGYAYYAQYYSEAFIIDTKDFEANYTYKTELYKAKLNQALTEIKISFDEDSFLPISMINKNKINETYNGFYIDLINNDKKYKLENIAQNRYHNIKFKKGDNIMIKSPKDLLIGKHISMNQSQNNKKKLVLVMFIDAFSASLFEKYQLKELVPNTYDFFKKGAIFKKCYSNSEYTISSLASMFSGKYIHNNNFFHPRERQILGENQKIISQYFQDQGYFTQLISSNSGQNPYQGYCLGFDRVVYKNFLKHQSIVYEFMDSLRVFKDRDTFTWLSFMDIHHNLNLIPSFSAGINMSLNGHNYSAERAKTIGVKTPFMAYCPRKTERYLAELKKVDYHMKIMYDYIEKNFKDEDVLISLVSDHGTSFTDHTGKTEPLLRKEKVNVPFMIRGTNFKGVESNEMIENVDILPTILNFTDIQYDKNSIDGEVPKSLGGKGKECVFAESIYPKQTYKATVKDEQYECFLEGNRLTQDDGKINLLNYTFKVEDIITGIEIKNSKVVNKYKDKFRKILKNKAKI